MVLHEAPKCHRALGHRWVHGDSCPCAAKSEALLPQGAQEAPMHTCPVLWGDHLHPPVHLFPHSSKVHLTVLTHLPLWLVFLHLEEELGSATSPHSDGHWLLHRDTPCPVAPGPAA